MKRFFAISFVILFFLAPLCLKMVFSSKNTLYVYSWSAYLKPEVIEKFQKKFHCSVVLDTYDSNEAMYTKLKLGGSGYDIVFPSNYFLDIMEKENMLLCLDERKIPHGAFVDWDFLTSLNLPKNKYGVPFMVSFSGIAWRKDRLSAAPDSWSVFANPDLKGRMTMLNDMRETLGAALLSLGYSANTTSREEIDRARDLVNYWKKFLVKLESEQYKNGIATGEYLVVHGYSGDCLQVARHTKEVAFSFPKEGSVVTIDSAAIMKSSRNPDLAYAFINFLHDPKIAAENMEYTFFRCLNTEAEHFLSEEFRSSPLLYPEREGKIHLECLCSVGPARKHYLKAWDSVKSS